MRASAIPFNDVLSRTNFRSFIRRLIWILACTGSAIAFAESSFPTDAELEAQGAVIDRIAITPLPIFDEHDPAEDRYLFRLANRLHVETKPDVIRAQLLFAPGDRFSADLLRETERNLRKLRFIREPRIEVVGVHGNLVDLAVRTTDVWTTNPTFEFGRSGGSNRTSIGIQDFNFLGLGKTLELSHKSDRDRTANVLAYSDPNLGYSRWRLDAKLSDNSDGHDARFAIERPFFALDAESSFGLSVKDTDALARRYALGEVVDVHRRRETAAEVFWGFSEGLSSNWTERHSFGARLEHVHFDTDPFTSSAAMPPTDRRFAYPFYRYEAIEDDFATTRNRDSIGRTEDELYGRRVMLELGLAAANLGSDRDTAVWRLEASDGLRLSADQSLFLRVSWSGRFEDDGVADSVVGGGARYFWRTSEHSSLYAALTADLGHRLDDDHDLYLGGDNGLRAYPIAFQGGEKRALFTLEQRYFTDWRIFNLFTAGAAAFVDIGRVWGPNSIAAPLVGTVRDFGIGLRFGNLRSARANILHIDLAWPLDDPLHSGPQLMIETRSTF